MSKAVRIPLVATRPIEPVVRLSGFSRRLGATRVFDDPDRTIASGEFVAGLDSAEGNGAGLVGIKERVADAMLDHHDLGIDRVLIHGFQPREDAIDYGREWVPAVRDLAAPRYAKPRRAAQ